jgi:hypothetical protein
VRIDDPDTVRVIKAGMEAPKGARFALQVDPGTGVGVRRGTAGARTRSFTGPLHDSAREPDQAVGQDQELLLRIDFVPDG